MCERLPRQDPQGVHVLEQLDDPGTLRQYLSQPQFCKCCAASIIIRNPATDHKSRVGTCRNGQALNTVASVTVETLSVSLAVSQQQAIRRNLTRMYIQRDKTPPPDVARSVRETRRRNAEVDGTRTYTGTTRPTRIRLLRLSNRPPPLRPLNRLPRARLLLPFGLPLPHPLRPPSPLQRRPRSLPRLRLQSLQHPLHRPLPPKSSSQESPAAAPRRKSGLSECDIVQRPA